MNEKVINEATQQIEFLRVEIDDIKVQLNAANGRIDDIIGTLDTINERLRRLESRNR